MTAEHQEGAHQGWNVKLRLAIDADNADEAGAIAAEVWRKMEVTAGAEPQITQSAGRVPHWNVITDLDLSALESITPDDAATRFRYVIRNLPGVVFTGGETGDRRSGLWQWLPDSWELDWQQQELAHPAVLAAGIGIVVVTKKNRYPGFAGTHSVHVAEIDPRSRSEHNWTVKLRLAIDAGDESEARAIAGEVIHAMDVVANELQVTHSASRRPFWDIVTDLDLSPAGNVTPDDALTRFRYVIRKLPGVTFMSPRGEDARTGLYQWLPDEWNTAKNYEELAHPAVRAAGIYISADPAH